MRFLGWRFPLLLQLCFDRERLALITSKVGISAGYFLEGAVGFVSKATNMHTPLESV